MQFGSRILIAAEQRFGKLALPGILRWIAGFQFLGFLLMHFSKGFVETIAFDKTKILSGEVWRLFSWIFIPGTSSFLFIIVALFLFFLNDALEEALGTFRLNVYVGAIILFLTLAGMSPLSNPIFVIVLMWSIFFTAMIFAAASFYPNYMIYLMGIIPIKLKWLAWADAALLIGSIATSPLSAVNSVLTVFALLPFLITIFPVVIRDLKQSADASVRRANFQRNADTGGDAFHTCHSCGITDTANPEMEFRVAEDGEEYCLTCRESLTEDQ